jgi:hypothetical protein
VCLVVEKREKKRETLYFHGLDFTGCQAKREKGSALSSASKKKKPSSRRRAAAISYVSHEASSFHYGKRDTLFPHGLSLFLPAAKKEEN